MSQGRAIYTMQFARYEEAPKNIQEQIIEAAKGKTAVAA
jgi:translation elongation factor EF-G